MGFSHCHNYTYCLHTHLVHYYFYHGLSRQLNNCVDSIFNVCVFRTVTYIILCLLSLPSGGHGEGQQGRFWWEDQEACKDALRPQALAPIYLGHLYGHAGRRGQQQHAQRRNGQRRQPQHLGSAAQIYHRHLPRQPRGHHDLCLWPWPQWPLEGLNYWVYYPPLCSMPPTHPTRTPSLPMPPPPNTLYAYRVLVDWAGLHWNWLVCNRKIDKRTAVHCHRAQPCLPRRYSLFIVYP